MRLQKLTIHNIASYEDAVIDFEKEPLNSADVFLISGITGSGKSTILDSICMALYGKTPRIEESDTTSVINRHEDLTLTDSRRFLRRNAGEGFVALEFNASGINFEARWGVRRARNNPKGKLQKREWTLTDLDHKHQLSLETEIKARIDELIGLDYDQFCRTTMLSQGEFDKFLRSKESEKAEILQKITGADIYERIGREIYARTRKHKNDYDDLAKTLKLMEGMEPEEIEELNQQIAANKEQVSAIDTQIKELGDNRTWLNNERKLADDEAKLQAQLQTAIHETETDDFRAAVTDIEQYDATGEARTSYRQIAEQQKIIAANEQKIASLRSRYAALMGDCAAFNDKISALKAQLTQTQQQIDDEAPRKAAYDAAGEISTQLRNAVDAEKKAAGYRKSAEAQSQNAEKTKKQLDEKNEAQQLKAKELENAKAANDEAQADIDKINVADLRHKQEQAQTTLTNIGSAKSAIALYKANCKVVNDINESIKAFEKDSAEQTNELDKAKAVAQAKLEALKDAERTRDRQRAAAGESAEALRNSLHPGDTCPVCGQTVNNILPIAETLRQLLEAADEAYNKANQSYLEANNEVQKHSAQIDADNKNIADSKKRLTAANNEVDESYKKMLELCESATVRYQSNEQVAYELAKLEPQIAQLLEKLKTDISNVDKKQAALNAQVKNYNDERKKYDALVAEIAELTKKHNDIRSNADRDLALAKEQDSIADGAKNHAATLLENTPAWDVDVKAEPLKFVDELNAKRDAYTKLTASKDALDKELNNITVQADAARKAAARTAEALPEWADVEAAKATGTADVAEALNTVAADVKSATDSIFEAKSTLQKAQTALGNFYNANPDISAERLAYLTALTDAEVLHTRKTLNELNEKVTSSRGALEQAEQAHGQHTLSRPKALCEAPETTAEQLDEKIDTLAKEREELSQQSGAMSERLKANDKVVEQRRNVQTKCDKAAAIYNKWKALDDLLGDSEGKNFRTIALSYVLKSLIRSANVYMSRLSDRYTLSVQPGTFIILVTDAYQGYVTRTVNTISGGETFIVSLALALALSDLGTVTGIDTLFIDEGFATLSDEPLRKAIETLRLLHSSNRRRVGIISHVAELRDRIPVQIQVTQSDRTAASTLTIIPSR